ncbi:MAG TPA: OmpA family protein, partial [Bacillota bacterium]|nr:OmpA family protein [Bacillota bacterium]
MKKLFGVICSIGLLLFSVIPVRAEVELTLGYGWGGLDTEWVNESKAIADENSDLDGVVAGLGLGQQKFRLDFDYLRADLADPVGGDDDNILRDWRIGYRFHEAGGLSLTAFGSYIDDRCGVFRAKGPAVGLGFERSLNRQWSVNGRIGYSPFGVKVQNGLAEYEDAAVLPVAVGLKYQISDNWSIHTGYRYYGFLGETGNADLDTKVDLLSVGLSYKFATGSKGKPSAPVEPNPEASPTKERQERINQFLQPVFFDLDCDRIRPDQIRVLRRNLKVLKANSDFNIIVAGHADYHGTTEYNQDLSLRRAQQVKGWLLENGI